MLRSSYYLTALIAALTTLIAVLADSQPLPAPTNQTKPQNASEQLFNATMPVCYIQLENGQVRDLRRLCGKKSTSSAPSRNVQRLGSQPDPDLDDDDSTPTATPKPRTAPSQPSPASTPSPLPTSTKPAPQSTTSSLPGTPDRPTNQPFATPSTSVPGLPNPLAIPEENPR